MIIGKLNVRLHQQGEGAPFIDGCTTMTRDRDGITDEVVRTREYRGWSICPLWFMGVLHALAVTWLHREYLT